MNDTKLTWFKLEINKNYDIQGKCLSYRKVKS